MGALYVTDTLIKHLGLDAMEIGRFATMCENTVLAVKDLSKHLANDKWKWNLNKIERFDFTQGYSSDGVCRVKDLLNNANIYGDLTPKFISAYDTATKEMLNELPMFKEKGITFHFYSNGETCEVKMESDDLRLCETFDGLDMDLSEQIYKAYQMLVIDDIAKRIYANAMKKENYINGTFIQYLDDKTTLIISKDNNDFSINMLWEDIEGDAICNETNLHNALCFWVTEYFVLRGKEACFDFDKAQAFRVEHDHNELNTPSKADIDLEER